ncbi:tyrosine-type recombinase/integrase [Tistrella mobilis]|uniref:Phage integrase family protein n=1 Tax=Tistrella mobilis (strain KA081020-065) TaxID=1110502 RepID=I3TGM5_TISMK|nr:tyrosine-type recombinase/integrase [Tistrella mobilis]AFK51913.1 phage integrase family protein [Tistrella mobilis KA081020-065]
MATVKVPYLRRRQYKTSTVYYWQPSASLAAAGWPLVRLRLPDGTPCTTEHDAAAAAGRINAEVARWRRGETPAPQAGRQPAAYKTTTSLAALADHYQASLRFKRLAPKTRYEYGLCLRVIVDWAGREPARSITRGMVADFYAQLYQASHSRANAILRVLRLLYSYACSLDRTHLLWCPENPASAPEMISTPPRVRVFTREEEAALITAADAAGEPSIADALLIGIYVGQRQADILSLTLRQLIETPEGLRVRIQQAKTKAQVDIPLHPRLADRVRRAMARARLLRSERVILDRAGRPWTADHFRRIFQGLRDGPAARLAPTVVTARFQDARDTAVTRLAEASATIPEICAVTGHDLEHATRILHHYMALTGQMADSAIAKLVTHEARETKTPPPQAEAAGAE